MSEHAPGWMTTEGWKYEPNDEASWWFTYFASLIDESGVVPLIEQGIADLRLPGPKVSVSIRLFLIMMLMQARRGGDLFVEGARGEIRNLSLCIIEDPTNGIVAYPTDADGEPDLTKPYLPNIHRWYRTRKAIERVVNVDEYDVVREKSTGKYMKVPRPAAAVEASRRLMHLVADTLLYCSVEPDETVERLYPYVDELLVDPTLTPRQRRTRLRELSRAANNERRRLGLPIEAAPHYKRTVKHGLVGVDGTADVPRVSQEYLTAEEVLALPHPFTGIRDHGKEDKPRCYEMVTAMAQTQGGAIVVIGFDLEPGNRKAPVPAMHLIERLRDRWSIEGVDADEEFTQSRAFMGWVDATEFGIVYNPPAAHLKPREHPTLPLVHWAGRWYAETIPASLLPTSKRPSKFNTKDPKELDVALTDWRRTKAEREKYTPYEHQREGRYGRKSVNLKMGNRNGHCVMCAGWRTPLDVDDHVPNPDNGRLHQWCASEQTYLTVENPNRDEHGNQIQKPTARFGLRQMVDYATDEWADLNSLMRNGTEQLFETMKEKHGFSTAGSSFRCHGRTARYLAYICWLVNLNLRAQGIAAPASSNDGAMDQWLSHGHRRCVGIHGGNCRCFAPDHVCEHAFLPPLTSHETYRATLAALKAHAPPEAA